MCDYEANCTKAADKTKNMDWVTIPKRTVLPPLVLEEITVVPRSLKAPLSTAPVGVYPSGHVKYFVCKSDSS